jgi:hypothetical protein
MVPRSIRNKGYSQVTASQHNLTPSSIHAALQNAVPNPGITKATPNKNNSNTRS